MKTKQVDFFLMKDKPQTQQPSKHKPSVLAILDDPTVKEQFEVLVKHAWLDLHYPRTRQKCITCGTTTTLRLYVKKDRERPRDEWHIAEGLDSHGRKQYRCDNCYRSKRRRKIANLKNSYLQTTKQEEPIQTLLLEHQPVDKDVSESQPEPEPEPNFNSTVNSNSNLIQRQKRRGLLHTNITPNIELELPLGEKKKIKNANSAGNQNKKGGKVSASQKAGSKGQANKKTKEKK